MNQQEREFESRIKNSRIFKCIETELMYLRQCIGLAPYMPKPDPPVNFVPKPGKIHPWGLLDRRHPVGGRRLSAGDRRVKDNQLWIKDIKMGKNLGYRNTGLYWVYNGHLLKPEKRARPNRRRFGDRRHEDRRQG